jgi:hypothetical protein
MSMSSSRYYDRIGEPYSPEEMAKLLEGIRRTEPEVYQTILGHEQALDAVSSFGLDGPAAEHLDRLHGWVDYFVPQLSDDPEEDDEEGMIRHALAEAETVEEENDEEDRIPPEALKALIPLAMEHARHVWLRQRVDAMVYAREQFDESEVLARMATPDAEISVLRQGFVLLMTAFDAARCSTWPGSLCAGGSSSWSGRSAGRRRCRSRPSARPGALTRSASR